MIRSPQDDSSNKPLRIMFHHMIWNSLNLFEVISTGVFFNFVILEIKI